MQRKKYDGGYISDITNEYKEKLIENKSVDSENCHLIKEIIPKINEGRNNDGIGFVKIDGIEYFLKYNNNLIDEFRTGYYLSKLRDIYPYFLNVHTILNCKYKPRSSDMIKEGHILIADKGTETVYQYLNRNTLEYFNKNIPEVQKKTLELDSEIEKIEKNNSSKDEKMKHIEELIKKFYLDLSIEYVKFKTDFEKLFIHNYKIMLNLYLLLDVVVMTSYNDFFGDKKCDNYMVKIEKETDITKTNIEFTVNHNRQSKTFNIDNTCIWGDNREHVYIYPVDFGSCTIHTDYYNNNLRKLQPHFLNSWISSLMRLYLYSDVKHGNGNFLSFHSNGKTININFSKYYYEYIQIFHKYNLFSIRIINPLNIYVKSFEQYTLNDTENEIKKKLDSISDYRLQSFFSYKYKDINLLDAIEIINIFFSGSTAVKDKDYKGLSFYRRYEGGLSFYDTNGINYSPNEFGNIYKTFIFSQKYHKEHLLMNKKFIEAFNKNNENINDIIEPLFEKIDINTQDDKKNTSLILSIRNNNIDNVKLLLDNGADINLQNNEGNTPLMVAVLNENNNIIELLLKNKAKINLKNNKGYTALLLAVRKENIDVVKLLISYDADINIRNDGESAIKIAVLNNNLDIVKLLLKEKPYFYDILNAWESIKESGSKFDEIKNFIENNSDDIIEYRKKHSDGKSKRKSSKYIKMPSMSRKYCLSTSPRKMGFSQKASCKAQGLLKRTSKKYKGKYVISPKYKSKRRSKRKLKSRK